MNTTIPNPSITQDGPVGAGSTQEKHTGRKSIALPHPIDSLKKTFDNAKKSFKQTLYNTKESLKGATNGVSVASGELQVDSVGSEAEIDSKDGRTEIKRGSSIPIIWSEGYSQKQEEMVRHTLGRPAYADERRRYISCLASLDGTCTPPNLLDFCKEEDEVRQEEGDSKEPL